jgi:large subunit ribosomal protein L16
MLARKKQHNKKSVISHKNEKNGFIAHGLIGLKTSQFGILEKRQIESVRKFIMRKTKRNCKIWIKVRCLIPVTKKGKGSRMGKGAGAIDKYVYNVKKGIVLFEVMFGAIIAPKTILKILLLATNKLSIPVKIQFKSMKGISMS